MYTFWKLKKKHANVTLTLHTTCNNVIEAVCVCGCVRVNAKEREREREREREINK